MKKEIENRLKELEQELKDLEESEELNDIKTKLSKLKNINEEINKLDFVIAREIKKINSYLVFLAGFATGTASLAGVLSMLEILA